MRTAGPLGFRTQSFSAPRTSPRPAEAFCYIFAALRYVFRLKVTGGFFRLGLACVFLLSEFGRINCELCNLSKSVRRISNDSLRLAGDLLGRLRRPSFAPSAGRGACCSS